MTLYPETWATILPREDYDAIIRYATGAQAALEFGPGLTTLALIEAGVPYIESFEHERKWRTRAAARINPHVPLGCSWRLRRYDARSTDIPLPHMRRVYDLGIVDAPQGGANWVGPPEGAGFSRLHTLRYALANCRRVLLHDADREGERRSLVAAGCGWEMVTGKLALCSMS